jgi:hypothetical protein
VEEAGLAAVRAAAAPDAAVAGVAVAAPDAVVAEAVVGAAPHAAVAEVAVAAPDAAVVAAAAPRAAVAEAAPDAAVVRATVGLAALAFSLSRDHLAALALPRAHHRAARRAPIQSLKLTRLSRPKAALLRST